MTGNLVNDLLNEAITERMRQHRIKIYNDLENELRRIFDSKCSDEVLKTELIDFVSKKRNEMIFYSDLLVK